MNKRLANVKTRKEAGLDYVVSQLQPATPFGLKALKGQRPFFPGEEEALERELDRVEAMMAFVDREPELWETLQNRVFHGMKDVSFTIARSEDNILSVVELFELKNLLLQMDELADVWKRTRAPLPEEFLLEDTTDLLDELDPRKDRLGTFYIYEEFSEKLGILRNEKRQLELALRRMQKEKKEKLRAAHEITLTPKFDCTVSKTDTEEVEKCSAMPELEIVDQDYMSITFALAGDEETEAIRRKMEAIQVELEEEEERIRGVLSQKVWGRAAILLENCRRIGELDFTLAKALLGRSRWCVRPKISSEYLLDIEEGRHLYVEDLLRAKEKTYMPISIHLEQGVTCITGANMGGKTVTLKLVGLIAVMAQYGYFVPCKRARIGLSAYMQMLIGDSQSVERGLSSFGSEMEELKEILDHSKDRSLLLIDEIASGTNPQEGLALTRSLIDYLKGKNYITLMTTHFDVHTHGERVRNMQVVGLAHADFDKLNKEIRYANRRTRIQIIGKHMDYRLRRVDGAAEIPKDALNIAKMLGIGEDIIDGAKKYLGKQMHT